MPVFPFTPVYRPAGLCRQRCTDRILGIRCIARRRASFARSIRDCRSSLVIVMGFFPLFFFGLVSSFLMARAGMPPQVYPPGRFSSRLPRPVRAPAPILTGATSIVSEPMNTSSPISVGCFFSRVVIAGDRPRPNVRIRTDLRVANVGEVSHLHAFGKVRIFHLAKLPM